MSQIPQSAIRNPQSAIRNPQPFLIRSSVISLSSSAFAPLKRKSPKANQQASGDSGVSGQNDQI